MSDSIQPRPPLEPIPPRPGRFWHQARWRLVPWLVFLLAGWGAFELWQRNLHPVHFVGQVETLQATVNTPDAGYLTNLWVAPFQEVKAGDLVAEITTTDPRTVNNRLELMRDRMRMTQLELEPVLSRQRAALEFERLSVECARLKAEVEIARTHLVQAENQLRRDETLHKQRMLSDELYELSLRAKQGFEVEVQQKSRIVEATEKALQRLTFLSDAFVPGGENDPIKQALAVMEDRAKIFEDKMKPLPLLAPMAGVVTLIHRREGEQVQAGEAIATITSEKAERIVAYIPPTFPLALKPGQTIEVRPRARPRLRACARILALAPHWESVTNLSLPPLSVRPTVVPGSGRAVSVSVPPELHLAPGEYVDLTVARE